MSKVNEIVSQLEAALQQTGEVDGATAWEIADAMGVGIETARRHIKTGIRSGRIKMAGRRKDTRIDGRACLVPVYQVGGEA